MTVTFQVETLADAEKGIAELIDAHWREVADHLEEIPLDVDWDLYRRMEQEGSLFILTVRDDGRLVGYVAHVVACLPHYRQTLVAKDDAHYLRPEYRKGGVGAKMILKTEQALAALGVKRILYHTKLRSDIDRTRFFERLGYEPIERIVSKVLEE